MGDPVNDYVILGEGNTSAKIDADSFWVKASDTELRTSSEAGSVETMLHAACLALDGVNFVGQFPPPQSPSFYPPQPDRYVVPRPRFPLKNRHPSTPKC